MLCTTYRKSYEDETLRAKLNAPSKKVNFITNNLIDEFLLFREFLPYLVYKLLRIDVYLKNKLKQAEEAHNNIFKIPLQK